MKVVFLTDQLYLHGGVEKVLSQKANYLTDIVGYEVSIITYNQKDKQPVYPFSKRIQLLDMSVNYEISSSYFSIINLKKIPQHHQKLLKVLRQLKPDVIISSSFGPDFYFLPYLERQIPKIKEFHGSRFFNADKAQTLGKKMVGLLTRFTERKYDCIAVLNESEKQYFSNRNIVVMPNPAEITNMRTDLSSNRMMAAGRISPVKNFADLITAFSRVSADFPDWELHFYGEDYLDTQRKLEQQVGTLGLESQIKFKGVAADLKKEMENYSLYAMTSETECFPMVLLEALSVGLPIITYDAPTGPRQIVCDMHDGFIVPHKNLDIFTAKLKMLMTDENLRKKMGANGPENVQRYSIEKVMQQWMDLFKKLT